MCLCPFFKFSVKVRYIYKMKQNYPYDQSVETSVK
jgi:hypothetical protein